jgi:SAM-dependent methyltransferase
LKQNPFETNRVPARTDCKCCQSIADIVGVVDFSRCGVEMIAEVAATGTPLYPNTSVSRKTDPYVGWAIYYYRCRSCFFTFTRAFDSWTTADFAQHVYNADYARHDPDYLDARPSQYSDLLTSWFGPSKERLTILDYGSGSGLLQQKLESNGFSGVASYDPFTHVERPPGRFDLIVCVEVFEHVLEPVALLADLNSSLKQDGAILLSTLCCSQAVVDQGFANWWYCVPRNGHISFYSPESLALLAQPHGLQYRRLNDYLHVMHRHPAPAWLSVLGVA